MADDHTPERPVIRENVWYRLSNSEKDYAIDVVNVADHRSAKIELRPTGDHSGQLWRILKVQDGLYSLQTKYLGPDKLLDVFGNDPRIVHLAVGGAKAGQRWYIKWWPGTDTFKLTNTYGGLYLSLDTRQAKEVVMAPQDMSSQTQRWRFTPIEEITS